MGAKRNKQYRKLMHQYALNFGFRPPYQVLLDADIIKTAGRCKMRLGSLLEKTLNDSIKPMITQCCIRHLYKLPAGTEAEKREKDAWIEVAKQAERRRCGHHELEEPLSAEECLLSVVDPKGSGKNKHRYVVATQDQNVRARMRNVAGVPLVYINRSVMILEPMAAITEAVKNAEERGKIRSGLKGRRPTDVVGMKRKREGDSDQELDIPERAKAIAAAEGANTHVELSVSAPKKRKIRGPKGPNPLSVKKPKKDRVKISSARPSEDGGTTIERHKPMYLKELGNASGRGSQRTSFHVRGRVVISMRT
ncbi:MAG: hypothetical protein FE78DRAFT_70436 [Acidomyces sp. 'richmondensis']|nr:MAG: hypothetical protein FE78DRAFT_70436 [Acidomyces sp. 'richmondensis']